VGKDGSYAKPIFVDLPGFCFHMDNCSDAGTGGMSIVVGRYLEMSNEDVNSKNVNKTCYYRNICLVLCG